MLGGTFNPVHLGHLLLAESVWEACRLDRVWFVPCHKPPHKPASEIVPGRDRVAMLRAALAGDRRFSLCRIELRRGGVSYAVVTLRELQRVFPGNQWFFISGMDGLLDLHHWREAEEILRLCTFVTVARPGLDPAPSAGDLKLPRSLADQLLSRIIPGRGLDLSSSEIRARVASGKSIRYLVPEAVASIIKLRRLYSKQIPGGR